MLVSLPRLLPLVILRGSGETTAALARHAAEQGVRTLAHAEGGGVLYCRASADPAKAVAMSRRASTGSESATGSTCSSSIAPPRRPCWRRSSPVLERLGIELRGTERARGHADAGPARRSPRPRVGERRRARRDRHGRRRRRPGGGGRDRKRARRRRWRRPSSRRTREAADAFLDRYRGTAAFWQAPTRFTDGFALTGAPETGINVDWVPGPRGPVTYRDLWLRQYRVVGDGTQRR